MAKMAYWPRVRFLQLLSGRGSFTWCGSYFGEAGFGLTRTQRTARRDRSSDGQVCSPLFCTHVEGDSQCWTSVGSGFALRYRSSWGHRRNHCTLSATFQRSWCQLICDVLWPRRLRDLTRNRSSGQAISRPTRAVHAAQRAGAPKLRHMFRLFRLIRVCRLSRSFGLLRLEKLVRLLRLFRLLRPSQQPKQAQLCKHRNSLNSRKRLNSRKSANNRNSRNDRSSLRCLTRGTATLAPNGV
jgi:hypothetical protein